MRDQFMMIVKLPMTVRTQNFDVGSIVNHRYKCIEAE